MEQALQRQRGFTLIELLVVISIILLLATFGLSKLTSARRDAELAASKDRLGQIYAHLQRYETVKRRLPTEWGPEFVPAIWGGRYLEKSVNNAKIFFCESLAPPDLTDDTLEDEVTPETIHWAGRNQEDKNFKVSKLTTRNASKKIIVCNKPLVDGELPHQGKVLAVLYASGDVGEIEAEEYGIEDGEPITVGPESPVEALQGLDDGDY